MKDISENLTPIIFLSEISGVVVFISINIFLITIYRLIFNLYNFYYIFETFKF